GSSRLVNRRSIASPPYLPRGRLIECSTTRLISVPGGRLSLFGDGTRRAPPTQSGAIRIKRPASPAVLLRVLDAKALHAVAQRAEAHAEQPRRGRAVEVRLGERGENRFALDLVEKVRQRHAGHLGAGRGLRRGLLGARRLQTQVLDADLAARRRQRDGALEDV